MRSTSSTTARASMLCPCPTGPSFSAVLAFTFTCSGARSSPLAMRSRIAEALGVAPDQVNVKAKTAEKLGPVGMGQSIEARAVVLLTR